MKISTIKKSVQRVIMFLHVFFTPFFFLHAANDPTTAGRIVNPIPAVTSIPGLIHRILEGILKIGIPFLALAIIYSGFLFITARGNSEKLEKAKDSLLYTIIGGAILLGSWAIAQMIESTILGITS